eukprot:GILK01014042.1.p1 GENE.GILK01014042.1~~GILK01014042.1.p1  ORF type:complete len:523 (+),score=66.46 GILK01014042.1:43-1569(+)
MSTWFLPPPAVPALESSCLCVKAILYENGRVQVDCDDGSMLILHRQPTYCTHFSRNGQRLRQLVRFATHDALPKIQFAMSFRNWASDSPIFDNRFVSAQITYSTFVKLTHTRWAPVSQAASFIQHGDDASISIQSLDGNVTITLSSNKQFVLVICPLLIPQASTAWCKLESSDHEKSIVKRSYLYTKLEQCFHITSVPCRWQYPVYLLLNSLDTANDLPHDNIRSWSLANGEVVTELPSFSTADTETTSSSSVWEEDELINVTTTSEQHGVNNFPECSSSVVAFWTPSATFRRLDHSQAAVVSIVDDNSSLFVSTAVETVEHIFHSADPESSKTYILSCLPERYKDVTTVISYPIASVVNQALALICHQPRSAVDSCVHSSSSLLKQRELAADVTQPFIVEEATVVGVGKFTLYRDDRLYAIYEDRSVLQMVLNQELCRFTDPMGHMTIITIRNPDSAHRHMQVALEFIQWCRTPVAERVASEENRMLREVDVQNELNKINNFLTLFS